MYLTDHYKSVPVVSLWFPNHMSRQQRATLHRQRVEAASPHDDFIDSKRLALIELSLKAIENTLDVQFKRIAALQAQVDRLSGKQAE